MAGKAVIFDMDGVMFDTERVAVESWMEVCRREGIEATFEKIRPGIGVSRSDAVEVYKKVFGEDFPWRKIFALTAEYQKEWTNKNGVPVKPGLLDLLASLRASGFQMAVASSTDRERVTGLIKSAGIGEYFDAVICGDMVKHSKPDPEIFLKAAEELGVSVKDCFILEDSPNGIKAGAEAGARVIMIPDLIEPGESEKNLAEIVTGLSGAKKVILGE